MRACVFEDYGSYSLAPLTLTRPAFDLWCGVRTLLERQRRYFQPTELGALVRPALTDLCRVLHADVTVNDGSWLAADQTVLINGRWLPLAQPAIDFGTPQVGLIGEQVAYAVVPADHLRDCSFSTLEDHLLKWKQSLLPTQASGWMMDYPWDLIERNAEVIHRDLRGDWYSPAARLERAAIVGPVDKLFFHPEAKIEPYTVFDTTHGPILVDAGAVIEAFSRLEGPCYIGRGTSVLGARVRAATIGPCCKLGGEIESSIVQGYTNKAHLGFLGHSYLGDWVNVGAGTEFSDLRSDYGSIHVTVGGEPINTGLIKVGSFVGDHSKTGLNALLNAGTVVGAFCGLLPTGGLLPRDIPSFSTVWNGQLREEQGLDAMLATAARVMRRRGCELTPVHSDFYRGLYDWTAIQRHQVVRENQLRRLRRSV
jgi:UDP-N-acetylglucosamine diphosphorylase/glucosamine-1-phosphate N-acetyltransferase